MCTTRKWKQYIGNPAINTYGKEIPRVHKNEREERLPGICVSLCRSDLHFGQLQRMIHIIILLHFFSFTMGSILFYEFYRTGKEKLKWEKTGSITFNLAFAIDAVNLYCRHWQDDYSMDFYAEVICILLFLISMTLFLVNHIQLKKLDLLSGQRFQVMFYLLVGFFVIHIFSRTTHVLKGVPWACIGYLVFCMIQFWDLFMQKEPENDREAVVQEMVEMKVPDREAVDQRVDDQKEVGLEENGSAPEVYDIKQMETAEERVFCIEGLTPRENEIVMHICEGKNNKEIAELLFISQNTVRNHIYNIYRKLEVKNKVELLNKVKWYLCTIPVFMGNEMVLPLSFDIFPPIL